MKAIVAGLTALLLSGCAVAQLPQEGEHSRIRFRMELRDGNGFVDEQITVQATQPQRLLLSRNILLHRLNPLAWQRIGDLRVTGSKGELLRSRLRTYREWANIDLLQIPADGRVRLQYTVYGIQSRRGLLKIRLIGLQWNLPAAELSGEVVLPQPADGLQAGLERDWNAVPDAQIEIRGRTLKFRFPGTVARDKTVDLLLKNFRWPEPVPSAGLRELVRQNRVPLAALAAVLLLSVAGLFVPARAAAVLMRGLNWGVLLPAGLLLVSPVRYWFYEFSVRGGDYSNSVTEIFASGVFLQVLFFFIYYLNKQLKALSAKGWYLQFGMGAVLFVMLPMPHTGTLLLPLCGFLPLIFWMRGDLSLLFGIGVFRVAAFVQTRGEVPLSETAREFGLTPEQLRRVLEGAPDLPLAADYRNGILLSPENAALKENLQVCRWCGGAEILSPGAGMVECGYCGHSWTDRSKPVVREKPVPLAVQTGAVLCSALGYAVLGLGVFLWAVFFLLGLLNKDGFFLSLGLSLLLGALAGAPGWLLLRLSRRLSAGSGLRALRWLLLAGAPLVMPLLLRSRLRSRRVLLHFGLLDLAAFEQELKKNGELSLQQTAAWLECSPGEALSFLIHVTGNGVLDAVYERKRQRLVDRELYRKLAEDESCDACGGLYGIVNGRVACQYCGYQRE